MEEVEKRFNDRATPKGICTTKDLVCWTNNVSWVGSVFGVPAYLAAYWTVTNEILKLLFESMSPDRGSGSQRTLGGSLMSTVDFVQVLLLQASRNDNSATTKK